jgi:uncharacterized paraquat-inducible protein A
VNQREAFKLDCAKCGETVEFPAATVLNGRGECPRCATELVIEWRAPSMPEPGSEPFNAGPEKRGTDHGGH